MGKCTGTVTVVQLSGPFCFICVNHCRTKTFYFSKDGQQLIDAAEQENVVNVVLKRKNERRVSTLSFVKALRARVRKKKNSNTADFLLHQVLDL